MSSSRPLVIAIGGSKVPPVHPFRRPHIYLEDGRYVCESWTALGRGATAVEAYRLWWQANRYARCEE
jgi:hypothetical protein